MTSAAVPSLRIHCILESPGILCDVTTVVGIPTACGDVIQCLWRSPSNMLSQLSRFFGKENGELGGTNERPKESGRWSWCRTKRNKWSWGSRRSTGKASSQASTITEQEQQMKKLEKLTKQIHNMTCERDELRGILAHFTDKDLNNRLNFELAMLEMEHQNAMLALQKLPKELSETLDKYKELAQETESCCFLHSRLLIEWTKLKHAVKSLRTENRKLQREQVLLQKSWEETKRLCEEAHEKICGPWAKQQQDQDGLEERLQDPMKQKELVTQQKDLAEKMQHQLDVSEMRKIPDDWWYHNIVSQEMRCMGLRNLGNTDPQHSGDHQENKPQMSFIQEEIMSPNVPVNH